jgi:hypothetical protein
VSIQCVIAKSLILSRRADYPEQVSDEVIVEDICKNYMVRYFAPWRRQHYLKRGSLRAFIAKRVNEQIEDTEEKAESDGGGTSVNRLDASWCEQLN